jgi:large subunit ribosomal protein L7A
MMLDRMKNARKCAIGSKQATKALEKGSARVIYLARDADQHVTRPLHNQCESFGVEVIWVDTMNALGKACGIEVGAAAVAVVEE